LDIGIYLILVYISCINALTFVESNFVISLRTQHHRQESVSGLGSTATAAEV